MESTTKSAALGGGGAGGARAQRKARDHDKHSGSQVKLGLLAPILKRVDRRHCWIKESGRNPCHKRYRRISPALIDEHLRGPTAYGACPIRRGESTTRLGLLDLDDHKGELTWSDMADAAGRVFPELERRGLCPVPFRSRNGRGIHLFMLWESPQDAYSVRTLLREAIEACGFKDKAGGVADGKIEIFPKQDDVITTCEWGSMFILPFAGESCLLDPVEFAPMQVESLDWRMSEDVPILERPKREARIEAPPEIDAETFRRQLCEQDPNATHDDWFHNFKAAHWKTGGADWAFEIVHEWCDGGRGYRSREELRARWNSLRVDHPNPVTEWLRVPKPADVDDFDEIPADPAKPERRIIKVRAGELHIIAAEVEEALAPEVYTRGHKLARIGGAREIPEGRALNIQRADDQPVILPVGPEFIRRRAGALCRFEKFDSRTKKPRYIDCPKDVSNSIHGYGDWPTFRWLAALASAPFVRSDMTVCAAPGYDADSGVFYIPNAQFPPVPDEPTQRQAAESLATLAAPYDEFPYTDEASRSAFIAHILTEVVRIGIDVAPVFTYSAPEAGTGKTLLAEMPARIAHGHTPAMHPMAEGEELRKVLYASLLAGDRTIGFDDIGNGAKVRSKLLCGFATASVWSDRKLGHSEMRALPNNTVVFLTGNNITPSSNLARRSVVIRLDAGMDAESLKGRRFKIQGLKSYVDEHRPELLTAALTIVRAFVAAGCPEQAIPLPSFEQWSRLARDPLLWLGMADPVETQAAETDDEAAPLAGAFTALGDALQGREFTAGELVELCTGIEDDGGLRRVIEQAGCSDAENPRVVGYWLRDCRDRVSGGWKLKSGGKGMNGIKWRFVQKVARSAGHDLL